MLLLGNVIALEMKRKSILSLGWFLLLGTAAALGQTQETPVPASENQRYSVQGQAPSGTPVSYASITELNGMLAQLETTSKNTQADLVKLRIERWKTDSSYKKQTLANVD